MRHVFVPAAAVLLVVASAANAHPRLLSATPGPNAMVAGAARLELRFSERLMLNFSGADLVMTGRNGTERAQMRVASATTIAPDGYTLVIRFGPLAAGTYSVAWRVVAADTHRITGNHAFAVK